MRIQRSYHIRDRRKWVLDDGGDDLLERREVLGAFVEKEEGGCSAKGVAVEDDLGVGVGGGDVFYGRAVVGKDGGLCGSGPS